MFIPKRKIGKIVKSAHEDVLLGVEALLNDPDNVLSFPNANWLVALEEARRIDPKYPSTKARTCVDFIGPFLTWLEKRNVSGLAPWVRENNKLRIPEESPCRWFLDLFCYILEDLIEPGHSDKAKSGRNITYRLRVFGNLIAKRKLKNRNWILSFFKKPPNENLYGFASWLMVYPKTKEIYIMYDKDQISEPDLKGEEVVERLEKIFLHELGHARSDLRFYLGEIAKPQAPQFIRSTPVHETHAWLYSHVVRAFISSARARICRLIQDYDNEWK